MVDRSNLCAQQRLVKSVHAVYPLTKHRKIEVDNIAFSKYNARVVKQPYDDPLEIMLAIGYNIHRVLDDNGSSVDIMYMTTF